MNTREIIEEIVAAIYDEMRKNGAQPAEASAACVKISTILDRHLEGKAVLPKRPQMKEGDLLVLMETLHKGRMYCIANYVAAHKFAKYPDDLIARTAQEMFHSLDGSLIAEAESGD